MDYEGEIKFQSVLYRKSKKTQLIKAYKYLLIDDNLCYMDVSEDNDIIGYIKLDKDTIL
jgi:hypothetical protein